MRARVRGTHLSAWSGHASGLSKRYGRSGDGSQTRYNSDVAADVALATLGTTQLNTSRYTDADAHVATGRELDESPELLLDGRLGRWRSRLSVMAGPRGGRPSERGALGDTRRRTPSASGAASSSERVTARARRPGGDVTEASCRRGRRVPTQPRTKVRPKRSERHRPMNASGMTRGTNGKTGLRPEVLRSANWVSAARTPFFRRAYWVGRLEA
jgi:hypothetical protein